MLFRSICITLPLPHCAQLLARVASALPPSSAWPVWPLLSTSPTWSPSLHIALYAWPQGSEAGTAEVGGLGYGGPGDRSVWWTGMQWHCKTYRAAEQGSGVEWWGGQHFGGSVMECVVNGARPVGSCWLLVLTMRGGGGQFLRVGAGGVLVLAAHCGVLLGRVGASKWGGGCWGCSLIP